jgi:competence protein ComEC
VGQGLSILFQLPNKIILYDTGPEFASGQNAIDYVVSPYLKDHGIYHIDRLIVSHSDSDHAGGVQTLKNQFNIGKIDTTFVKGKPAINVKANQCQNGRQWHEGSIHFAYLNPSDSYQYARGDNNTSCVLKIHMNHTSILLTGDIKYKLERHLVKHYGSKLDSEVLIAPHHGSKSSSHLQFVNSVDPDYVIYSAGYNNRYDHPHQEVIKRYKKHNTFQLSTSQQGAISVDFYKNGKINLKSYLNKENNVY